MCYAIPGKIIGIDNNIVTVDYFGERKKARNDFYQLLNGDYVYAQGGFIIQKITEKEALPVLEAWKELFFKLKEVDSKLGRGGLNLPYQAGRANSLYQRANSLRQKYHGNSCCVHGIIEFSNHCRANCLYCGIRKDNAVIKRYRMSPDEIIAAAEEAVNLHKFKALVLQSGEDPWYDEEKLSYIAANIRQKAACLIVLSIGEREISLYEKLYRLGARGILLRFETSNEKIYEKMRPGRRIKDRIEPIKSLHDIGYLVMTGFLIGLPGQTEEDITNDIKLTKSLGADMFSFGPFIPHPATPLAGTPLPSSETVLETIAASRIASPEAQILVNTSFETLDRKNAVRMGLMAGANSLMINVTPEKYKKLYEIYPDRAGINLTTAERVSSIIDLLRSIGRAPTDLDISKNNLA